MHKFREINSLKKSTETQGLYIDARYQIKKNIRNTKIVDKSLDDYEAIFS